MKIHHMRNATFVIESGENHILIDPMLSDKGALPAFAHFRHPGKRNPIVDLPENAPQILDKVTHCLITHSHTFGLDLLTHTDHLDPPGKTFLKENNIPVGCSQKDGSFLTKKGIRVENVLNFWQAESYLEGKIIAIPAQHSHGWINFLMANGAGYYLELPGEPSIYISGDTVFTDDVHRALTDLTPDIAVVAAGAASMDIGGPILMPMNEIITFIRHAPKRVIANHMESLNHCPTKRSELKQELDIQNLLDKTDIPSDGQTLEFKSQ
jgi:L-ascorbate metabolism protein UlaG (beta-lactamase superfamily)